MTKITIDLPDDLIEWIAEEPHGWVASPAEARTVEDRIVAWLKEEKATHDHVEGQAKQFYSDELSPEKDDDIPS